MSNHIFIVEAVPDQAGAQPATTSLLRSKAGLSPLVAIIASTCAIIAFYFCLFRLSYNFPYFDDYEVILDFLNRFLTAGSLSEKLRLLFEQHNEHRVVFDRTIALLEYYGWGAINFRSFIIIGNAALIVILILFAKASRHDFKTQLVSLAPVVLLLFNFRYFETSFWAMAAMQNLWVLAFAFLAFYYLFQSTAYSIWLALLFGVLATFTSANGMVTFVAAGCVLVLNGQLLTRKALIWGSCGMGVIAIYMIGYVKPANHPGIITPLLDNPLAFFGYVFAFLGGMFTEDVTVAAVIGGALLSIAGYLTFRKYFRQNPIIYSLIVFLVLTAILAGISRSGFGIEQALASRYAIASTLFVVSCYVAVVSLVRPRLTAGWWMTIVLAGVCFHYSTYAKYLPAKMAEKAEFEKNRDLINQGRLSRFDFRWSPLDVRREFPRQVLRGADALGYFSFKFKNEAEVLASLPPASSRRALHHFDRFERRGPIANLSGWALVRGFDSDDVIPVLCFKDGQGKPVKHMVLQAVVRSDVAKQFAADQTDYLKSGFETWFDADEITPGNYTGSLFLVTPDFKIEIDMGPTRLGQ